MLAVREFLRNKLFQNIIIYGASNGVSALVPFLLLPILTSHLSPEEFGVYSIFLLMVGVFTILAGLNVNGAASVFFFKMKEQQYPDFISGCCLIIFLSSVFLAVVFELLKIQVYNFLKVESGFIILAIVVGGLNAFYLLGLAVIQASEKAKYFFTLKVIQAFVEAGLSIITVVVLLYGLTGRVSSYALAIGLCAILSLTYLFRSGYISGKIKPEYLKKTLMFGLPLLPHALSGSAIMFIDRLVLNHLADKSAVGYYMVALQLAMIMLLVVEPVNRVFAPWLFKNLSLTAVTKKRRIVIVTYAYFVFLLVLASALYFSTDILFVLLVDEQYFMAKELMPFLFFGFAFQGMYYAVTNYVFYVEKTGSLSVVTLLVAIISVVMSYSLVSYFGIIGASVSFMLSNLLLFLFVWAKASQYVEMPWLSVWVRER